MNERIDYKLLQALAAVIKAQSFEAGAAALFITQSAISQRIKQLEQLVSQPVIVRSTPPKATEIGKKLISHFYQVEHLERGLLEEIFPAAKDAPLTVHMAVNADTLATWLIPSLTETLNQHPVELNLQVVDEEYTLDKLKGGEVFGAISTEPQAVKGCEADFLGEFEYALVSSPAFRDRYFRQGLNKHALKKAPSAAFDHKDDMHINFIRDKFKLDQGEYPLHKVQSSEAFVTLATSGVAFCLIPLLQIREQLDKGELVDLMPDFKLIRTLYWHRWVLLKGVHKKISDAILAGGSARLNSKH